MNNIQWCEGGDEKNRDKKGTSGRWYARHHLPEKRMEKSMTPHGGYRKGGN